MSDPIQTKFGWHLVKVLDKMPVSYKPFADVKAELLKREQDTQFQKKLAEYLDKLKRDAVIQRNAARAGVLHAAGGCRGADAGAGARREEEVSQSRAMSWGFGAKRRTRVPRTNGR